MTSWHKYYDLDPFKRLKNEGRELLGKEIIIQEKRDGSNVSLWLDGDDVRISSHNLEKADDKIILDMKNTKEYKKVVEFLKNEKEYNNQIIVYGELLTIGKSPTRIERPRKRLRWVMFDIFDVKTNRYWDYNLVYQRAFQFKIPIVKVLEVVKPQSLEELEQIKERLLVRCKKCRREGFVGKNYSDQIFFKEKIDLPKIKREHKDQKPQLPVMPDEKILRALQHAWDEIHDEEKWKDRSITMPIIARHISAEAREHDYSPPINFYSYYINTPLEKIKRR